MVRLLFEIGGMPRLAENLRGAAEDVQDWRDAWPDVGDELRKMGALQIASAGASGGSPYPPLRPSTVRFKERHFPGKGILRRTDEMFRAVGQKGAPGSIEEMEPESVAVGVRLKRAALHQKGTRRMAARPVYAMTPQAADAIFTILDRAGKRKLERRGLTR